jgi:hypothetical protein
MYLYPISSYNDCSSREMVVAIPQPARLSKVVNKMRL